MRAISLLSIAFVLGATSTPTLAEPDAGAEDAGEPYQVQIVPRCKVYQVPGVGEICGYLFLDDWRAVATADAELVLRRAEVDALTKERDAERERGDKLDSALESREILIGKLSTSLEDERKRFLELDEKYQRARGTRWTTWVAWGLAACAASALAGIILAD